MFKPPFYPRSPLGCASAKNVRAAWVVAILIALAAGIFSGPRNRSTAESALEYSVAQTEMDADEDDLVW
jgi:hypothetical protein